MDEANFVLLADRFLSELGDKVNDHYSRFAEADYDDGVLTIQLPAEGEYVLNRHTPSQQIWLSSPVSGPSYYTYDDTLEKWRNNKDSEQTLTQTIMSELEQIRRDT